MWYCLGNLGVIAYTLPYLFLVLFTILTPNRQTIIKLIQDPIFCYLTYLFPLKSKPYSRTLTECWVFKNPASKFVSEPLRLLSCIRFIKLNLCHNCCFALEWSYSSLKLCITSISFVRRGSLAIIYNKGILCIIVYSILCYCPFVF